jgi:L-lactate permease
LIEVVAGPYYFDQRNFLAEVQWMGGIWQQRYVLVGNSLGWSAALAILPTLLLLYLLAVKRKASWIAALSGLAAALLLAVVGYGMPPTLAISSALDGACFGLFPISWIVFWALVLYEISVVTGKFEIIKESIGSVTSDKRVQALLIAFAFGAFI